MPKRDDGNEQDLRVRPELDAKRLDGDNPMQGREGGDDLCKEFGDQEDLIVELPGSPEQPFSYDWKSLCELCPKGFDTRLTDRLIVGILKTHFANPDNIIRDSLKDFVYTTDPATNGILIAMNTTWTGAEEGKLPAIVVKRGKQVSKRAVMGDRVEDRANDSRYVRYTTGTHRLLCLGTADGVTEDLANEVWDVFQCASVIIRTQLPMHDFEVAQMSELAIIEDLGSKLGVALDLTYKYEYGWTMEYTGANLRRVRAQVTVDLQQI